MTNDTTDSMFSTHPVEVGITLRRSGQKVNGFPVIASMPAPGRGGLVVLCLRDEEDGHRPPDFVTWCIWKNEKGTISAESGHYDMTLEQGLVDLHDRAGGLDSFKVTINQEIDRQRSTSRW